MNAAVEILVLLNHDEKEAVSDQGPEDDHEVEDDVPPGGVVVGVVPPGPVVRAVRVSATPVHRSSLFLLG